MPSTSEIDQASTYAGVRDQYGIKIGYSTTNERIKLSFQTLSIPAF